jgi:hypothetical protein
MDFLFFNAANQPIFTRNDAEQAEWTVEQFSFFGLFPFDPDKVIQRGQRVAFQDADGKWQAFEIRKAKSYEPDHYQEITAEHIAVSELTDEHVQPKEWTSQTARAALSSILTGTLWSIGTVTASGTSSGNISYGSVWQGVNTIASNWNVYILPRITIGPSGITGRYLDITPAQGNWRGLRLSINSNIEEVGVTYDDTNVLTAMYGYGKTSTPEQPITPTSPQPQDLPAEPLTFTDVTWSATTDHPAKPYGQAYLENPTAKALYGRNGRNRFGFYQNGDVTDPNVLLDLTWKALKKDSEPLISIEGTLHDLQRLGYADQTIRLHDTAIVEILPAGVEVQREIIQLDVDLLNPLATRVTIGAYIPNIIYINKETAEKASGGGGGGGGGGRGQTDKEKEWSEFETQISANQYQILLRAWQQNKNNEILRQAGIQLNAQGVLVYAEDNELNIGSKLKVNADAISAEVTRATAAEGTLSGRITVNADNITAEVSRATTAEGTLSGRISVNADNITAEVSRATTAEGTLSGRISVNADNITAEVTRATTAEGNLSGRISVNADNITAEVTRATAAEGTLSSSISINADNITSLVTKTGVNSLGQDETLYSQIQQNASGITAEVTRATAAEGTLSGQITVEAGKISQIVSAVGSNGQVTAASIVSAVNSAGSSVVISADHIQLNGETVAQSLSGQEIRCDGLTATGIGTDNLDVSTGVFTNLSTGRLNGEYATWKSQNIVTSVSYSVQTIGPYATPSGAQASQTVGSISNVSTATIYYLSHT